MFKESKTPVVICTLAHPLVDNFRTFEWPRASDLEELVAGSRAENGYCRVPGPRGEIACVRMGCEYTGLKPFVFHARYQQRLEQCRLLISLGEPTA